MRWPRSALPRQTIPDRLERCHGIPDDQDRVDFSAHPFRAKASFAGSYARSKRRQSELQVCEQLDVAGRRRIGQAAVQQRHVVIGSLTSGDHLRFVVG